VQRLEALFLSTSRPALTLSHFSSDYKTDLIKEVKKKKATKAFNK
jgi:hypothetical protein